MSWCDVITVVVALVGGGGVGWEHVLSDGESVSGAVLVLEVERRALGEQVTIVHQQHALGQHVGLVQVMRAQQYRATRLVRDDEIPDEAARL